MGCSKSCSKKDVHSDKCFLQETREISNKLPAFPPQETKKRRINEAQSQQNKGNNKDKAEISEIESQKTKEKINETRANSLKR